MAEIELKKILPEDIQAHHNLFYHSVDRKTNSLRQPTDNEKIDRLSSLLKHHTKSIITKGTSSNSKLELADFASR